MFIVPFVLFSGVSPQIGSTDLWLLQAVSLAGVLSTNMHFARNEQNINHDMSQVSSSFLLYFMHCILKIYELINVFILGLFTARWHCILSFCRRCHPTLWQKTSLLRVCHYCVKQGMACHTLMSDWTYMKGLSYDAVCVRVHACVCVCVSVCVHMCVCVHVCVC